MSVSRNKVLLLVTGSLLILGTVVAGYANKSPQPSAQLLGIEVELEKPFYVPASINGKKTFVVFRVPDNGQQTTATAVKLEPKMEGDKVSVNVSVLFGDPGEVKKCSDWNNLRSQFVETYSAGMDQDIQLSKLSDFGVRVGSEPILIKVVPRRALSPLPPQQDPLDGGGCDCGSCGQLICCPNPGACVGCGSCGSFCCGGG